MSKTLNEKLYTAIENATAGMFDESQEYIQARQEAANQCEIICKDLLGAKLSENVYTEEWVIKMLGDLLQRPDMLIDAVANEHTSTDAKSIFKHYKYVEL